MNYGKRVVPEDMKETRIQASDGTVWYFSRRGFGSPLGLACMKRANATTTPVRLALPAPSQDPITPAGAGYC